MLLILAVGLIILALVRSLQYGRGRRVSVAWSVSHWTPPYAPHFKTVNSKRPASHDFTVEGIHARRAAAQAIAATDNTEFIADLLAYRCKACLALYAYWVDAFECHKRNEVEDRELLKGATASTRVESNNPTESL